MSKKPTLHCCLGSCSSERNWKSFARCKDAFQVWKKKMQANNLFMLIFNKCNEEHDSSVFASNNINKLWTTQLQQLCCVTAWTCKTCFTVLDTANHQWLTHNYDHWGQSNLKKVFTISRNLKAITIMMIVIRTCVQFCGIWTKCVSVTFSWRSSQTTCAVFISSTVNMY